MAPAFPDAFLQRISAYPDAVQTALKANLDEPRLRDYIGVLHGPGTLDDKDVAKILTQPPVADAFLGRQLLSRAFTKRVRSVPDLLRAGTPTDLATLIEEFIAPLSDPQAPYLYKLREITEVDGEKPAIAADLQILMSLVTFFQRAQGFTDSATEILIHEIFAVAGGKGTPFLPCIAQAFGAAPVFPGSAPLPEGLTLEMGAAFVRVVLANRVMSELSPLDIKTLKLIQRDHGDGKGQVILRVPRRMCVVITGGETRAIPAPWQAALDAELIAEVVPQGAFETRDLKGKAAPMVAYLPAATTVSPLLLAYLRCLDAEDVDLELRVDRRGTQPSWLSQAEGYVDPVLTEAIGRIQGGAATAPLNALEVATEASVQTKSRGAPTPTPDDCYAVIVTLDDTARPDLYLNADRCLVLQGLDALRREFSDASRILQEKPVVLLGQFSPDLPDYLVDAVQAFWAYAGRYPVTPLSLSYDGMAGRLRLTATTNEALSHMALADLCVLPLKQALALDPEQIVQTRVVLQTEGLIVEIPGPASAPSGSLLPVERALAGLDLDRELREALFVRGTITHDRLAEVSVVFHWPVAHVLKRTLSRHARLEALLKKFSEQPALTRATAVLSMLVRLGTPVHLRDEVEAFLLQLSASPDIVSQLDDDVLQQVLVLTRQSTEADAIAENLLISVQNIGRNAIGAIIPLFELFACCLPQRSMDTALAFLATDPDHTRKACFRVGECLRRYGSTAALVQFLVFIRTTEPKLLKDPAFLKFFPRILENDAGEALWALVGKETLVAIADLQEARETFRHALNKGDRDHLIGMLRQNDQLRRLPLTKWLDGLRGFSNEMADLRLPVAAAALPQLSNVFANKLMAVIFADEDMLGDLDRNGHLEDDSDLSLAAKVLLGQNAPVNTMLAARFEDSGLPPLQITGATTEEVFTAAAAMKLRRSKAGPKVSVIMSAYEADIDLLKLAIGSVLDQSHQNLELFVVDDASSVENASAVQALCASLDKVTYLRVEENSGPYVGRNLALEAATGEFIAIQDADDWSHPARFAQQLEAFAADPLLQLVTAPHIRIDRRGRIQLEADFAICGDGPMTSMFRRSVFDTLGGFANVRSRGDVEMRERIRGYFGDHTLCELPLPMMLCLADSATLSHSTKERNYEHLQLFRGNISSREDLPLLRRAAVIPDQAQGILVPRVLRPGLTTES